jgi:uncharacterized protein YndB with AHSA1/START domain
VTTFALPSGREITAVRVVEAPIWVVWDAWTTAIHVPPWLAGPRGWTMPVCEIDLRRGGAWRRVRRGPGGEEAEARGMFREVTQPASLVWHCATLAGRGLAAPALDWPEWVSTLVLTEEGGRTAITCTMLAPSRAERDSALHRGLREAWSGSYDRLDAYLEPPRVKAEVSKGAPAGVRTREEK